MKLWTDDIDHDCDTLSLRARGAWVWILFDLRRHAGSRSLTLSQWARVVRSSEAETALALREIIEHGICESSVTLASRERHALTNGDAESDAKIDVTCRRIVRESKASNKHNLRQRKYRGKHKSDAVSDAVSDAQVTRQKQEATEAIEAEAREGESSSSGRRVPGTGEKASASPAPSPPPIFEITEKPILAKAWEQIKAWAAETVPDIDMDTEFRKFQVYCQANGKRYADWEAAFQNWLLKAPAFNRTGGNRAPPSVSRDENNRRAIDQAWEMLEQQGKTP